MTIVNLVCQHVGCFIFWLITISHIAIGKIRNFPYWSFTITCLLNVRGFIFFIWKSNFRFSPSGFLSSQQWRTGFASSRFYPSWWGGWFWSLISVCVLTVDSKSRNLQSSDPTFYTKFVVKMWNKTQQTEFKKVYWCSFWAGAQIIRLTIKCVYGMCG